MANLILQDEVSKFQCRKGALRSSATSSLQLRQDILGRRHGVYRKVPAQCWSPWRNVKDGLEKAFEEDYGTPKNFSGPLPFQTQFRAFLNLENIGTW
jgi:hypothetical protein